MLSLVATILAQCACSGCTLTGSLNVSGSVTAGVLVTPEIDGTLGGQLFVSDVVSYEGTADWIFNSSVSRTSTNTMFGVRNNGVDEFTVTPSGNGSFNGTVTTAAGLAAYYWFAPYDTAAGLFAIGNRASGDPGPDLLVEGPRSPLSATDQNAPVLETQSNGVTGFQATVNGIVRGGTQYGAIAFQPNTGMGSGSIALRSASDNYLVLQGMLGNFCAVNEDGSQPVFDGGSEIQLLSDGGTCWYYAGHHGDTTLASYGARGGGWLFQVENTPPGLSTTSYFIDAYGGFGIEAPILRSQFPAPGLTTIPVSIGQYFYGSDDSVFRYAGDMHRWYFSDGMSYQQVETVADATQSFASMSIGDGGVTFAQGLADGGTVSFTISVDFH